MNLPAAGETPPSLFSCHPPALTAAYSISCCSFAANSPCEDAAIAAPALHMFAVADGHGGSECATFLQSELPKQFEAFNLPPLSPLELLERELFGGISQGGRGSTENSVVDESQCAVLQRSFAACEKSFFASHSSDIAAASGACVCACSLRGDTLSVAHVGDCRCVIASLPARDLALLSKQPAPAPQRDGGQSQDTNLSLPLQLTWNIRQVTVDHDCSNKTEVDAVRARSRDPDAIRRGRVNGVISVTRSIGDGALKGDFGAAEARDNRTAYLSAEPDTFSTRLHDSDVMVLLCSDGVYEHMSNVAAVKAAAASALQGLDPAKGVVQLAVQRACEAAGVNEREVEAMASSDRRRILDDATCVCLLRKTLLHRFEKFRGSTAKGQGDGHSQSAAESAPKRQKQTP